MRFQLAAIALVASVFAACTKDNPNYCADANDLHNCAAADAAAHEAKPETTDGRDAADAPTDVASDTSDSGLDAKVDAVVERPMCTVASCSDENPICDVDAGVCGPCEASSECKAHNATTPACDPSDHRCYECVTNADCIADPTKPICSDHTCGGCVLDLDCKAAPGLCMEDGSCLASVDAVFASIGSTDCPGAGTSAAPYCSAQAAVTMALAASKRAVVLAGPGPFSVFSMNAAGKKLAVIASDGGALVPGIDNSTGMNQIGISLQNGDLLVRGLEVKNGRTTAVDAEGGTIRLHRCFIHDNAGAGLFDSSAGFDVENTVFANNGGPTKANVDLEATASATKIFRNNTVLTASTTLSGVVCAAAYPLTGSIVSGGQTPVGSACVFTDTCAKDCSAATLNLNPTTYELTSTSPAACIDAIDPTTAPALDRLGTIRPQGTKSDCGADEFK